MIYVMAYAAVASVDELIEQALQNPNGSEPQQLLELMRQGEPVCDALIRYHGSGNQKRVEQLAQMLGCSNTPNLDANPAEYHGI